MAKKECLKDSTKSDTIRAIEASILCTGLKSSELKKDLKLGKKPVKDLEDAIKSLDIYVGNLYALKNQISEIQICT